MGEVLVEVSDFEAAIEAVNNNDEATLVALFNQFSAEEWSEVSYEWKFDNAEKVSDFIQEVVKILPASVEFEKVHYLVSESSCSSSGVNRSSCDSISDFLESAPKWRPRRTLRIS